MSTVTSLSCHRSSVSSYNRGCRCPGCREARTMRQRRLRETIRVTAGAAISCQICGAHFTTTGTASQHEALQHDQGPYG